MIHRGKKRRSGSAEFFGSRAWRSGRIFSLLYSYPLQVRDAGLEFFCVQYNLIQYRVPGPMYPGLDLSDVSARDAGLPMAGNARRSLSVTAQSYAQRFFRINVPSLWRGRIAQLRRIRVRGVRKYGSKRVLS